MTEQNSDKNYKKLVRSIERYNKTVSAQHLLWQREYDETKERLQFIQTFQGESQTNSLMLHPGEKVFGEYPSGLIEDRAGRTQYVGSRSGISFPIGSFGGHSIRYNIGSSRGYVEHGAPVETEIDRGLFVVTNQRLIFVGSKQTRECDFKKIIGINNPYTNRVVISTSNSQKATILSYDTSYTKVLRLQLMMAQADFQGGRAQLIESAQQDLAEVQSEEPKLQAVPTPEEAAKTSFVPPVPVAQTAKKFRMAGVWAIAVAAFFTAPYPIASAPVSLAGLFLAWTVLKEKPTGFKRKLIPVAILGFFLLCSVAALCQGLLVLPRD